MGGFARLLRLGERGGQIYLSMASTLAENSTICLLFSRISALVDIWLSRTLAPSAVVTFIDWFIWKESNAPVWPIVQIWILLLSSLQIGSRQGCGNVVDERFGVLNSANDAKRRFPYLLICERRIFGSCLLMSNPKWYQCQDSYHSKVKLDLIAELGRRGCSSHCLNLEIIEVIFALPALVNGLFPWFIHSHLVIEKKNRQQTEKRKKEHTGIYFQPEPNLLERLGRKS